MVSNQMCFSQSAQKLSSKLTDEQIQQLLRHVVKQDFNFASQSCKLHSENRKLIIMLHTERFSFFHVSFILQVILIVLIKIAEQVQVNLKI